MKVTWLGQAGLLFECGGGAVMIDPYLSNYVEKVQPANWRRVPVNEAFFDVTPDIMIFTHDHIDHFDPETAPRFLERTEKKMTVLSPTSVWQNARKYGGGHNYILFDSSCEWTTDGLRFTAVRAMHSDPYAIGVVIEDLTDGKKYYVTGDTLYSKKIFEDIPEDIYAVFLPINGVGNNMNATDAARFAAAVGAKKAVPLHFGLFDSISPEIFEAENRVIPKFYEEIKLS